MINSIGQSPGLSSAADKAANADAARPQAAPPAAPQAGPAPGPATAEVVTVSVGAQATTQLLGAARDAQGVDQAAVNRLGAAIQNGEYKVSADQLAHAITGAAKELVP